MARKEYTIEMPLIQPKEEEEDATSPIAEVYNIEGYIKGGGKKEVKVEEISPTSSETEESEDVRTGANNL